MAEALKELVGRLDEIHRARETFLGPTAQSTFDREWPRLRDSILAMRDYIEADADLEEYRLGADGNNPARELLARLDNPEPVTFGNGTEPGESP